MKSTPKIKPLFVIALGIVITFSALIIIDLDSTSGNSDKIYGEDGNLEISAVSGKIHIDNNWTAAKAAGICTGSGTESDPYVIKDLVIDGGGSENGIWIENSAVHFKIEDCTVSNSGTGYPYAGIRLSYVNNSQLIDNDCSSNYHGIRLYNSYNNIVSGNIATNNDYGIYLSSSNNNAISGNTANDNDNGIFLSSSDNTNIEGNIATNNDYGIYLTGSDYNNISGNTANNNYHGIIIYSSDNNIVSGNIATNNDYGISLYSSNNNAISGNTANDNDYGINLNKSNNTNVEGNTANNSLVGIYLDDSNDNNISGNVMNIGGLILGVGYLTTNDIDTTNLVNGKPLYYYTNELNLGANDFLNAGQVILVNCSNSLISNLNVSYSSMGISLYYCNNNTISRNTANNNTDDGIYLYSSNNNTISGNTANNNNDGGIYLSSSDNTNIEGNIATNNDYGIYLTGSDYNNISGNTANNNSWAGIKLYSPNRSNDYNIILGNTVNYNHAGIYLQCGIGNKISQNSIMGNDFGIYIRDSYFDFFTRKGKKCELSNNEISDNIFSGNGENIYPNKSENLVIVLGIVIPIVVVALVITGVLVLRRIKARKSRLLKDEVARYKKLKEMEQHVTPIRDSVESRDKKWKWIIGWCWCLLIIIVSVFVAFLGII